MPNVFKKIKLRMGDYFRDSRFSQKANDDINRFKKSFPHLTQEVNQGFQTYESHLRTYYQRYKTDISPGNSAASLRISAILLGLANVLKANKLLDLGSGFSSFVLRKYKNDTHKDAEVWSVDSDPHWLKKTQEYLQSESLSTEHLYTWDDFVKMKISDFDLIFLDVRPIKARVEWLERLEGALSSRGILVVDDVHKDHMRLPMLRKYQRQPDKILNLKNVSMDDLGRYSSAIFPNGC